ncbi:MAG: MarR family transcriptional regulator [Pseudomonadota bacterium]
MSDTEIAKYTDRLMRRVHAALHGQAHVFDTQKVGPIGGMVLLTLADAETLKINDLVKRLARDKSQVTRLVQTLETKGLIQRTNDEDDARVVRLALTPLGETTVVELQQAFADALREILSPLSAQEQATLQDLLSRL